MNKSKTYSILCFFLRFLIEIGITLIERMMLGLILTHIEVAYNITINEIKTLKKCHEMGLRKL